MIDEQKRLQKRRDRERYRRLLDQEAFDEEAAEEMEER